MTDAAKLIRGLDHVQVAAPPGCEQDARRYYGELLGLEELDKPPVLKARGGVWFAVGDQQLHVGVEEPFAAARKAHPALLVDPNRLDELADQLTAGGAAVKWDDDLPGIRRFYSEDPWGNRLELLADPSVVVLSDRRLLDEQLAYYRALAPEYEHERHAIPGASAEEAIRAVESFKATGEVLELACGTGFWTVELLRHASTVTSLDAAPEMVERAAARVREESGEAAARRVRFITADIFTWEPDRLYDTAFFGFWLSHVPLDRFDGFWARVAACLKPGGRVMFVDDAYRTPDELAYGEQSQVVRRRLLDGTGYRVVKVAHKPAELEERLSRLGWDASVVQTSEPFYYGVATLR